MRRKKSYERKKKVKQNSKEVIKKYRKSNRYLRSIGLTCKECSVEMRVNTTRPELYTKEVKENWICLNCSYPSNCVIVFQKGKLTIKTQVSLRVQKLLKEWGFKRRKR